MNGIRAALTALLLFQFQHLEAAVPQEPEPGDGRFAVELFRLETPEPFDETRFLKESISIEKLYSQPEERIEVYPVVYCTIGMAAVCDRTRIETLPYDYSIVNGKAVPVKKNFTLGIKAEVKVLNVKSNLATYALDFSYSDLKGYDEYPLNDDLNASLPFFETRKISTELKQSLGAGLALGGFSSSNIEGVQSTYYVVRITKP